MSGKCDLPLHGMTVVVDTPGPRLYIGRYDFEDEDGIVLRDAEVRALAPAETKEAVLARSALFGVFKTDDRITIPRAEIVSVRRLSDFTSADSPADSGS